MLSQEIETYYLIPAIRRKLVQMMVKKGIKRKEIAEKMHLTKAAVSQYISGKRGKIEVDEEILEECCDEIIKGSHHITQIQKLIKNLKKERKICDIYCKNGIEPEDCEVCNESIC